MKRIVFLLITLILASPLAASAQQALVPAFEPLPLSSGQLGIYRSFLAAWNAGSKQTLNVANMTEPFSPLEEDRSGCLKNFPKTHTARLHYLPASAFDGLNVHIVDPHLHEKHDPGDAIRQGEPVDEAVDAGIAAGIFTFSEMIFNADHTRAAFTYSFVCGGLCGNGRTIIFRRRNSRWIQEKNHCSIWES